MRADEIDAASRFLDGVTLIDGHNDLPYVIWRDEAARGDVRAWDARRLHPEGDTDIPRLKAGRVATQVFTAFVPTRVADPLRARLDIFDVMLQLEQAYPDVFRPVLEPNDLARAKAAGRIGVLKAVESLVGVESLAHLRLLRAMGARLATLCHNETLPFIDSATDAPGARPLSEFGARIVAEMERLGLIIDVAHASADAQHAVLDVARGPVILSHANARALCDHPRNAPDDVIRRVAEQGGLVMATFVPNFLSQRVWNVMKPHMARVKDAAATGGLTYGEAKKAAMTAFETDGIDDLAAHLDHMRDVAGVEALGIGSDFFGGPNPPGLEDVSTFPALFARLSKRGWSQTDLAKLAGGNFERVWRQVWREDAATL
jgi:membrane dipeptidase